MPFLEHSNGFAGWLFQAAWVPQHLMSASCVVMAMLLVARYAQRPSAAILATLVLTVAAGFESSTYVGGVTLAIAAVFAGPFLLAGIEPAGRLRFAVAMAVAAVLVACLVAPFVVDQLAATAARADATPIVIRPFEVLGDLFPETLRAYSTCRPIGLSNCRSNFPQPILRARLRLSSLCAAPRRRWKGPRSSRWPVSHPQALSAPGCWPARWATSTIWGCAPFCRRP